MGAPASATVRPVGEPLEILVVDDLPEKRLAFEALLSPLGQRLTLVDSGTEALRRVLAQKFHILVLDVNIPDMAQKARVQVATFVAQVLTKQMPEKQAYQVATVLTEGRWTHDYPITVQAARQLGLKVSTEMPLPIYELMELYPQGGGIRPSVWYVPLKRMRR